jgi:hypothetical protein
MANKPDGCEAQLFVDVGCKFQNYMNTAVFMDEDRTVGGVWRSMSIECGLPIPDPSTLGQAPFQDLMRGSIIKEKGKGGGKR